MLILILILMHFTFSMFMGTWIYYYGCKFKPEEGLDAPFCIFAMFFWPITVTVAGIIYCVTNIYNKLMDFWEKQYESIKDKD